MAAENTLHVGNGTARNSGGFNEAAAHGRGKQQCLGVVGEREIKLQ